MMRGRKELSRVLEWCDTKMKAEKELKIQRGKQKMNRKSHASTFRRCLPTVSIHCCCCFCYPAVLVCLTRAFARTLIHAACQLVRWRFRAYTVDRCESPGWTPWYRDRSTAPCPSEASLRATCRAAGPLRWRSLWVQSLVVAFVQPRYELVCLAKKFDFNLIRFLSSLRIHHSHHLLTLCKSIDCGSWLLVSPPFISLLTSMFLMNSKLTMKTSFSFVEFSATLSAKELEEKAK